MALGETLKLGYLECAVKSGQSPPNGSAHGLAVEDVAGFGVTLRFNENEVEKSTDTTGYVKDEAPIQPLEWTHQPIREVSREGNIRYQVSKAAHSHQKDNKIHLVRSTRIEPRPSSRSSSRPSSRPSSSRRAGPRPQVEGCEEILVREADFRRCGRRLTLLRQCQLAKIPPSAEEARHEMELSFKSAFMKKCLSQDEHRIDPWRDYGNPDQYRREVYEGDLVLNQVWVGPSTNTAEDNLEQTLSPPESTRRHAGTRANSTGACSLRGRGDDRGDKGESRPQSRKNSRRPTSHRGERRARSQGAISTEALETMHPLAFGNDGTRSCQNRHASGCPRPSCTRESSVTAKPQEYKKSYSGKRP